MNVTNEKGVVPTIQNNKTHTAEKVQPEPKRFRESQQTTSHDGVVIDKKDVKSTVERLNEFNDPVLTNLKFVFHEDLHEYYVTVVNPLTNEVIKEIPPKKLLDMYAAMSEYMGILVDERI